MVLRLLYSQAGDRMNRTRSGHLSFATLTSAAACALLSACGPQDGGNATKLAGPVAVATAPVATAPAPAAVTAPPTAPMDAPEPVAKPAPVQAAKPAAPKPTVKPVAAKSTTAQPVKVAAAPPSNTVGAVQHIEPITETHASGVGAVAGGALGGVLGHQFGKGDGKKAMTVLGAVGGAVAGHQVEKAHNAKVVGYRVQVQLDNGETRTFEPKELDGLKVGDRVRVDQGQLRRS
jgi:outer membrane lipoprotein SlyB